jgi:putative transposase
MARQRRVIEGGHVYHVLNRATARAGLFLKEEDYAAFERTLAEARGRYPLRMLSYVLMPNHFHLVVWPRRGEGGMVSEFMRWLQVTHTQRWHAHYHTAGTGHLYQGRFKSFPVEGDRHVRVVCRYVERNPLRAGLCRRAEGWRWSSLYRRLHGEACPPEEAGLLSEWPEGTGMSAGRWAAFVNRAQGAKEVAALRRSLVRGAPFGSAAWVLSTAAAQGLEHTLRPRGRPRKGGRGLGNDS